jgi:hypothetical protein
MRKNDGLFGLIFVAISLSPGAYAGPVTLFTDFGPADAFNCCAGYGTGHGAETGTAGFSVAASFTASLTATLNRIDVGVSIDHTGNLSGDVNIWLLTNSGGFPGGILESFSLINAATIAPIIVSANSTAHPMLLAGVEYWIAIAPPDLINGKIGWLFNSTGATAPYISARVGAGPWGFGSSGDSTTQPAFRVIGDAVPEPASATLLAIGLVLIFAHRRAFACIRIFNS